MSHILHTHTHFLYDIRHPYVHFSVLSHNDRFPINKAFFFALIWISVDRKTAAKFSVFRTHTYSKVFLQKKNQWTVRFSAHRIWTKIAHKPLIFDTFNEYLFFFCSIHIAICMLFGQYASKTVQMTTYHIHLTHFLHVIRHPYVHLSVLFHMIDINLLTHFCCLDFSRP